MTRARRILYVHNSADLYGASRSLLRLLPEVRARGYDARVVLPADGPLRERLEALGLRPWLDPGLSVIDRATFRSVQRMLAFFFGFPASVWRLRRLIRREQISLVHTNTGVIPSPALAARAAGVPHLWHVRDSFHEFRSLWNLYRAYIAALSSRVICVSDPIAAQFAGAPKVTVIHNGLPPDEFAPAAADAVAGFRAKHGLGSALVIGCVGRIKFKRKGQEILVQAADRLRRLGFAVKCVLVGAAAPGSEDHLTRLRQMIHDLGLEADVILAGELSDPKPAYGAMDVLALPSVQPEPFGGVVLEAMALRRPVVATAIGGSLDQVKDGETGFLVPPGDVEALAERLARLLRDAELRQRMGEAGRARVERCFSLAQMMERIDEVYRSVLTA